MKRIFVAGIGTDVGKTIVSAILCEALNADYWKPVQAGLQPETDSFRLKGLISSPSFRVYPEAYRLATACSPHLAARIDGVEISLKKIKVPQTRKRLIIEGAGGLLVPLNEKESVIDLIMHLEAPVILVSRNYLGSINHTMLSIEALRSRSINVMGIIFNGEHNLDTEDIIASKSRLPVLAKILQEEKLSKSIIQSYAAQIRRNLNELI